MSIRLLYITKEPRIGVIAQRAGVDWIFVDLEYRGKRDRQLNRDTVISAHTVDDVCAMRNVITTAKLLVRVNPIGAWSAEEIDDVIVAGADIIMLPYFKSASEVLSFVELTKGRVKTCLLLETLEAIAVLDEILTVPGIDYFHIGLNDIHIERKTTFMFEFLADGGVENIARKLRNAGIVFGFGGIARIGELLPPAEHILAEHYRLGSTGVILSRSFCHPNQVSGSEAFEMLFSANVAAIRKHEIWLTSQSEDFFERNRLTVIDEVNGVVARIKGAVV